MAHAEKAIDVNVPLRTAYNQWTQFEEFPKFMEGVEQVEQLDDSHLRWRSKIAGKLEEWEAEISEQVPDMRIAWKSTTGMHNAGVITFHRLNDSQTRLMLQLTWEPQGAVEKIGDVLGVVQRRVKGDLERFKEFIESRHTETGAWRGEVHQQHAENPQASSNP